MPGDPYYNSVVLLLHLDGSNGSTTITDTAPTPHACTTNSTLSTAQFKFGTSSYASNTALRITSPDSVDWNFGNGAFTVECWAYSTAAISGVISLLAQFGGSTQLGWFFGWNGTAFSFFYSTTGTDNPSIAGTYSPTLNTWTHYAADRDANNVLRVYANGVVLAAVTVQSTFFDSTRSIQVGNDENNNRGFIGYIDEVRVTKGVARYGGAFTPPTAPFPDFQDTTVTTNALLSRELREVLFTMPAAATLNGVVREALITTNAAATLSGVVREVLFQSIPAAQMTIEFMEEWVQAYAPAQLTQITLEEFATVIQAANPAYLTQIVLEEWGNIVPFQGQVEVNINTLNEPE